MEHGESSHLKYQGTSQHVGLAIRALLFGLLLALPTLLESFYYPSPSNLAFNDGDECVYLTLPFSIASGKPANSFYIEKDVVHSYAELLTELPSAPLDLAVGIFAQAFNLTPLSLGSLLDLFSSAVSYLIFAYFFSYLTSRKLHAETAAAFILAAPWVLSPYKYSLVDYSTFEHFAAPSFMGHSAGASLRALHTQLSYPLFALTLLALARFIYGHRSRISNVVFGVLLGLLSYTYVFAWLSAVCIVGFAFVFYLLPTVLAGKDFRELLRSAILVFFVQTLLAAPSLFLALQISKIFADSGFQTPLLSKVWFFSFEVFTIFLLVFGALLYFRAASKKTVLFLSLLAATTAAEFPLMNLQAATGDFIVPIHFPVFYLHPLFGALVFAFVVEQLFSLPNLRKAVTGLVAILLLLIVIGQARKVVAHEEDRDNELADLVAYVKKEISPESVLAWLPFSEPFTDSALPWKLRGEGNYVATFTGVHLLFQIWQANVLLTAEETLAREQLTAWIFSGKLQPIAACTEEIKVFSNDMYFQQWISAQTRRRKLCRDTEEQRREASVCELLLRFKVDYALLMPELEIPHPSPLEKYAELVWQSKGEKYKLYRFNQLQATQGECLYTHHIINFGLWPKRKRDEYCRAPAGEKYTAPKRGSD